MVTNHNRKSFGWHQKNSKSCSHNWHQWRFWSTFRHFGTHFVESFRTSKSSWMMDPTCSREMPSYSVTDLAEIWQSSKISSWIWSIISGVVTVLGHPGRGASQVEKSPRLNWATQFLMEEYAYSPDISIRMAWISFGTLPCRKKKTWWQLTPSCSTPTHGEACNYPFNNKLQNSKVLCQYLFFSYSSASQNNHQFGPKGRDFYPTKIKLSLC